MAEERRTYITEINVATIVLVIAWIALQLKIDMPGDVATGIALIVLAGMNYAARILSKKGWI